MDRRSSASPGRKDPSHSLGLRLGANNIEACWAPGRASAAAGADGSSATAESGLGARRFGRFFERRLRAIQEALSGASA